MNLFRSEEHVPDDSGETIPVATLCELAHRWWGDRLDADWRPHSRDDNQAILDGLGLSGPFWQLPPAPP